MKTISRFVNFFPFFRVCIGMIIWRVSFWMKKVGVSRAKENSPNWMCLSVWAFKRIQALRVSALKWNSLMEGVERNDW